MAGVQVVVRVQRLLAILAERYAVQVTSPSYRSPAQHYRRQIRTLSLLKTVATPNHDGYTLPRRHTLPPPSPPAAFTSIQPPPPQHPPPHFPGPPLRSEHIDLFSPACCHESSVHLYLSRLAAICCAASEPAVSREGGSGGWGVVVVVVVGGGGCPPLLITSLDSLQAVLTAGR